MSYNKLGFTSGQTLKAEHLNHMEDGIANVSWNDLTDKPFDAEVTFTELLPETTVEIAVDGGDATITTSVCPEFGAKYTIVFDGVEYKCVATLMGGVCVGNGTLIGADFGNGEPFFVGDNGDGSWFIAVQTSGTHTISVGLEVETVHELDEKYLPSNIGCFVVNAVLNGDGGTDEYGYYRETFTTDKSAQRICEAYNNGQIVVLKFVYDNYPYTLQIAMGSDFPLFVGTLPHYGSGGHITLYTYLAGMASNYTGEIVRKAIDFSYTLS